MELGQLCFGNPTREHPLEDHAVLDVLREVLDGVGLDGYGDPRHRGRTFCDDPADPCKTFDNGTLVVRRYYWGDCSCGYDEREAAADVANPHEATCFHVRVRAGLAAEGLGPFEADEGRDRRSQAIVARFCAAAGVGTAGWAVRCDCARAAALAAFHAGPGGDHAATCRTMLPNLEHRPSGLAVSWYKYAFRSATANRPLDLAGARAVADDCLRSLGPDHDDGRPTPDLVGVVSRRSPTRGGHAVCEVRGPAGTVAVFVAASCAGGDLAEVGATVAMVTVEGRPNRVAHSVEARP